MDSTEPMDLGQVLTAHTPVSITLSRAPRVICKDEPVFYSGGRGRRQEVRARRLGACKTGDRPSRDSTKSAVFKS